MRQHHHSVSYGWAWSSPTVRPNTRSVAAFVRLSIFPGWWLTYPSEKWWSESQLGWWHSQYMENIFQTSFYPHFWHTFQTSTGGWSSPKRFRMAFRFQRPRLGCAAGDGNWGKHMEISWSSSYGDFSFASSVDSLYLVALFLSGSSI